MELTKEGFGLNPRFVEGALDRVKPFIESALDSRFTLSSSSRLVVLVTTSRFLEQNGMKRPFKEEDSLLITRFGKDDGWWDKYEQRKDPDKRAGTNWEYYKQEAMYAVDDWIDLQESGKRRSNWFMVNRGADSSYGTIVACAGVSHQFSEMFASWACAAIRAQTLCGP